MKNRKRVDRIESALKRVRREPVGCGADAAWQRNLMNRVRSQARTAQRLETEFPVWRLAWAAAAMAAVVLGVSFLTPDSVWIPDSCFFNVRQAVISL